MSVSSRRALFSCACLVLLTFGSVFTSPGSLLPMVIQRVELDKTQACGHVVLMTVGILAGSLVFGPLVVRYRYKRILLSATGLTFVGLKGMAFAPTHAMLRLA